MGGTDLSVLPQRHVVFPETVFRSSSTTDVPLRVEGFVGQTSNLFEAKDASGNVRANIVADGSFYNSADSILSIGGGGYLGARVNVISGVGALKGLVVRNTASGTAHLQEWQNSGGSAVARVEASGALGIHHGGHSLEVGPPATQLLFGYAGGTNYRHAIRTRHHSNQQLDNAIDLFVWKFGTDAAGAEPTARVATFDAAGSKLYSSTTVSGDLYATNDVRSVQLYAQPNPTGTAQYYGAMINVLPVATDRKGIILRGQASQTANLIEVQRSDASVSFLAAVGGAQVDGRGAPSDSERLVVWASATQTQGIIQARTSAGAGIFSVYPGYTHFFNNHYSTYGPNSSWGYYLNVGGNNTQVTASAAAIATSNGNLHMDAAAAGAAGRGIYFNWYGGADVHGTYWGNGASGQVGRMDGAGAMSAVSFTSTSRLDTKMNMERVLETGPDDEKLMSLSAVKYNSVFDNKDRPLHSFVAEEVAEIMPEIVSRDENDEIVGINITSLITILTTQVQNLTARVRELEAR